jgi:hypothetical protein
MSATCKTLMVNVVETTPVPLMVMLASLTVGRQVLRGPSAMAPAFGGKRHTPLLFINGTDPSPNSAH